MTEDTTKTVVEPASPTSELRLGFIGLGQMGQGIAANLLAAGHEMLLYDLNRASGETLVAAGAAWADSPGQVAASCDVLFTSLPTPAVIESIAYGDEGLISMLGPNAVWFDFSTSSLELVRRLHSDLGESGACFLDAPVSGGPTGARNGDLAIWVGGENQTFMEHHGLLAQVGSQVRHIGDIGAGTTAKLLHNTVSATVHAALAEVLSVGVKSGIDPAVLFETLRSGAAGRRRTFDAVIPRFLAGKFEPASFQLQLAHKDLGLARRLAQDVGVPTRLCDLVYDELTEAMNRGWSQRDMQSFMALQQERAGIAPFAIAPAVLSEIRDRT